MGSLNEADAKIFRTAAAARFPSMLAIGKTVRIPVMQAAVWKHFGFEEHMEYPVLPYDMLYGTLSYTVHNKVFKQIFVSDMDYDCYKIFLVALGKIYLQEVVEYSEMDACFYEDKQNRKQASGDGTVSRN